MGNGDEPYEEGWDGDDDGEGAYLDHIVAVSRGFENDTEAKIHDAAQAIVDTMKDGKDLHRVKALANRIDMLAWDLQDFAPVGKRGEDDLPF